MSCNDREHQINFEAPGDYTSHLALQKNELKMSSNSFNIPIEIGPSWEPPFCISPCFKTPTYKYDIVILLHSKSRKTSLKNSNRFINKDSTPKKSS